MAISFLCTTEINAPIDVVFDLSRNIDAHMASMTDSGERAIAGVTHGLIGLDETVTWRARHFGLPFTLTSRIAEMDFPHSFVDCQAKGPFRRYRHEHRFVSDGGVTEMRDLVFFQAPAGPIGWVVERAILGRYMRRLIEKRNRHLKRAAESSQATT